MDIFTQIWKMLAKINIILKWGIVIGLIALALLSSVYKYDHCNKCSFEYNGSTLDIIEFMQTYAEKCFEVEPERSVLNVSGNISFIDLL